MKLPRANSTRGKLGLQNPLLPFPFLFPIPKPFPHSFPHSMCSQVPDMPLMVLPEVFQQLGSAVPIPKELQPEGPGRSSVPPSLC